MRLVIATCSMIAMLILFIGCESSSRLAYKPSERPGGIDVAADYALVSDKLQVTLDTKGIRVKKAEIIRSDGRAVPAQAIQHPRPARDVQIGAGTTYHGTSHRTGGGIGVNASEVMGNEKTILWYPKQFVGEPPYTLRIQMGTFEAYDIMLGVKSESDG